MQTKPQKRQKLPAQIPIPIKLTKQLNINMWSANTTVVGDDVVNHIATPNTYSHLRQVSKAPSTQNGSLEYWKHTSRATDPKLIRHIDVSLVFHALILLHLGDIPIALPLAAAKRAGHIARLGARPHGKAFLVDVLTTCSATPYNRLWAFRVKLAEADGAVTLDRFALVGLRFLGRRDRWCLCKDVAKFRT